MKKSRLLLVISIVAALAIVGLVVALATHKKGGSERPSLTITNSSLVQGIDDKDVTSIEAALLQKVVASSNTTTLYEATVRNNSVNVTYRLLNGIRTPYYTFLVDIPAAQRTYNVTFYGGDGYELSILYVLCPKQSQLIYQPFSCQDEGTQ